MFFLWYSLFIVCVFFAWTYIHEFAHLFPAGVLRKITKADIIPYPHFYGGKFYWARVSYVYDPPPLTEKEEAIIAFGPRIFDLEAIAILWILSNASFWNIWIITFLAGGVIDLATSTFGFSGSSDFERYSKFLMPKSIWRILQGTFVLIGVCSILGLIFL